MLHHVSTPILRYDIKTEIKRVQVDEERTIEKFVSWDAIKDGVIFASGVDDYPVDILYISEMAEMCLELG